MKRSSLIFLICMLLLLAAGIVFVFDASVAEAYQQFGDRYHFVKQQAMWIIAGLIVMAVVSRLPLKIFQLFGGILFYVSLALLVAVLIPGIGVEVQGARRWLNFGGFRFQPAELMKSGIVLYFSSWLATHQRFRPFLFFVFCIFGLLLLQPDMGTSLILGSISFALYIGAGGKMKHLLLFAVAAVVGISIMILVSPYRRERLHTFLDPDRDPYGSSYHIRQIVIALGVGGWTGQGIGNSRQKYQYIPEASTDSIFAIAAEEIGFLGSLIVFCIYAILIHQGFSIARSQSQPYARLVALGVTSWIASQTIVNLAAIVALVPLTGVPLPYISYGGSSMLSILAASGILIGIGRKTA